MRRCRTLDRSAKVLEGQAFVDAWAELNPEARRLASVPIYAQDLARCPRLLALDLVYSKLTEEADNILIKGTSLAGDRESEDPFIGFFANVCRPPGQRFTCRCTNA